MTSPERQYDKSNKGRRRDRRLRHLVIALGVVALAAGCGSDDGSDAGSLVGTDWTLDAESLPVEVPDAVTVTASFTDETIAGSSGCNTYRGSFTTTDDGGLEIGELVSTLMACEPDIGDIETAYLAALAEVGAYRLDGDTLHLDSVDGTELLRYTSAADNE